MILITPMYCMQCCSVEMLRNQTVQQGNRLTDTSDPRRFDIDTFRHSGPEISALAPKCPDNIRRWNWRGSWARGSSLCKVIFSVKIHRK